jgi:hypothetical protein
METSRVNQWLTNFYEFVKDKNPSLLKFYVGRIVFISKEDGTINPALNELDDRYLSEQERQNMWDLISTYSKEHLV